MDNSIQQQPENTEALCAIFAAHSAPQSAPRQAPELSITEQSTTQPSAEDETIKYASAIAAGTADNGSVAGIAIVEEQKQIRVEKEAKKKQQAAMMSELEVQAQRMINELQSQIDDLQEELDGKRKEKARLGQDETDILFLTQLVKSNAFDMSNPEHREVYERALIENPDLVGMFDEDIEQSERIRALDEALANTQAKIAEVDIEIKALDAERQVRISAIGEIRRNPNDARAILERLGIEGVDSDLDAGGIKDALALANEETRLKMEVSAVSLTELGVEEEIGQFMRDLAMF